MKVNILINKGVVSKEGKSPLNFDIYIDSGRFKIPTGISVLPEDWDNHNKKVLNTNGKHTAKLINKKLEAIELKIKNIEVDLLREKYPITKENLKNRYFEIKEEVQEEQEVEEEQEETAIQPLAIYLKRSIPDTDFFRACSHYISKSKNSKETKRKIKQVIGHLLDFKADFRFKDLTEDFYNEYFLDHLLNIPVCNNTIDKHIAEIKKICGYASRRGYKIPSDYMNFQRMYETNQRMALTWKEVEQFEAYEPIDDKTQLAQDYFLISCNIGLRYQSVSTIRSHNVITEGNKRYLDIITQKNNRRSRIILTDKVYELLKKYDFNIPSMANHTANKLIQTICLAQGFKDPVHVTKLYNKTSVTTTVEKWTKVTMHTARHTFACEFLRRNKDHGLSALKALKEILNQSSTSVTEIYWNMIQSEQDDMLLSTFSG
jgi:integrase